MHTINELNMKINGIRLQIDNIAAYAELMQPVGRETKMFQAGKLCSEAIKLYEHFPHDACEGDANCLVRQLRQLWPRINMIAIHAAKARNSGIGGVGLRHEIHNLVDSCIALKIDADAVLRETHLYLLEE